jgi:hypothetical protein
MHLTCFLFFAFFDVKKRGFACKLSRYAFAGRPRIITLRHCAHGNSTKKRGVKPALFTAQAPIQAIQ